MKEYKSDSKVKYHSASSTKMSNEEKNEIYSIMTKLSSDRTDRKANSTSLTLQSTASKFNVLMYLGILTLIIYCYDFLREDNGILCL